MQCVLVKQSVRCTHTHDQPPYGLQVPLVRPDALGFICYDCIGDLYEAMIAQDRGAQLVRGAATPTTQAQVQAQVRKEMGLL